jgi:DNA-binding IclR family transcriptional regulator
MSKTLLSRLAMFEVLDAYGPLTMTELSQRARLDLTVVSRTVAACEPDGWLIRRDGKVELGSRCALLAHGSASAQFMAAAEPLVHAVAGVTGVFTHANGLIGNQVMLIATAPGRGAAIPAGLSSKTSVYVTAGGRAIASQIDPGSLRDFLPAEPFPDSSSVMSGFDDTASARIFTPPTNDGTNAHTLPTNREQLDLELAAISATGFATDHGSLHPAIHCVAIPWRGNAMIASISCVGSAREIADNAELIRSALSAAAAQGADPRDIIAVSG